MQEELPLAHEREKNIKKTTATETIFSPCFFLVISRNSVRKGILIRFPGAVSTTDGGVSSLHTTTNRLRKKNGCFTF